MRKVRLSHYKWLALCAAFAFTTHSVSVSSAASAQPASAFDEPNLSAEARTLVAFVGDLRSFDKKILLFDKRGVFNRSEFDSLQRNSDDLKSRLSGVQSALRDAIRKLKAAGQWDSLDATVLSRITDPKVRSLFQQDSFRTELENAASSLSSDAREISNSLDTLRNKISAREELFFQPSSTGLEPRVVRASYAPVKAGNFRCRLAYLGYGLRTAFGSSPKSDSVDDVSSINCFCRNQCGGFNDVEP